MSVKTVPPFLRRGGIHPFCHGFSATSRLPVIARHGQPHYAGARDGRAAPFQRAVVVPIRTDSPCSLLRFRHKLQPAAADHARTPSLQ